MLYSCCTVSCVFSSLSVFLYFFLQAYSIQYTLWHRIHPPPPTLKCSSWFTLTFSLSTLCYPSLPLLLLRLLSVSRPVDTPPIDRLKVCSFFLLVMSSSFYYVVYASSFALYNFSLCYPCMLACVMKPAVCLMIQCVHM